MTTADRTRRMAAGLAFGLASLIGAGSASAQEFGFRSLGAAEDAVARIMEASGLRADFELVVEEGSRAAANIDWPCGYPGPGPCTGRRYIVYDPWFLQDIEQNTDMWGPISVMAHEVGHHLQGHTVFGEGSNPPIEIDADFFSGFVLQRLGASLESAQAVMRLYGSERGSSTHPPRRARLQAIEMGWRDAAEREGAGHTGGAGEALRAARAELDGMRTEMRRLEGRLRESEARAAEAEARVNDADARARTAQAARDAAQEALRGAQVRPGATETDISAAEARVRAANDQIRAAESEMQAAQKAQAAAEEALVAAREEFGEQAAAASAAADRAFLLAALLIPLVLVALGLALRKPRREVVRVMDRASRLFRGVRRRPDGSIDPGLSSSPGLPDPSDGFGFAGPRRPAPGRPRFSPGGAPLPLAPAFDGRGLERCEEPGGFVLGRDGTLVDAVLDHHSVSRRHARLTRLEGRLWVEDMNSANGTRVNGRRLEPFTPQVLAPGDAVVLGDVHLALAV